ncbi:MAG: SUMF1/EgtB/PvdO family nonheme iron enzyme [Alphaproteobacteria bacterium]|nr:SUMF1/EgtB/PvdO family nonheme iron enzyme [Alphaproteobacteria bacterium]
MHGSARVASLLLVLAARAAEASPPDARSAVPFEEASPSSPDALWRAQQAEARALLEGLPDALVLATRAFRDPWTGAAWSEAPVASRAVDRAGRKRLEASLAQALAWVGWRPEADEAAASRLAAAAEALETEAQDDPEAAWSRLWAAVARAHAALAAEDPWRTRGFHPAWEGAVDALAQADALARELPDDPAHARVRADAATLVLHLYALAALERVLDLRDRGPDAGMAVQIAAWGPPARDAHARRKQEARDAQAAFAREVLGMGAAAPSDRAASRGGLPALAVAEAPPGVVTLPTGAPVPVRSFLAATHESTRADWLRTVGLSPEGSEAHGGGRLPVEGVSLREAAVYANARSVRDGLAPAYVVGAESVAWDPSADGWRLPTAPEWLWLAHAAQPGHAVWGLDDPDQACRTANLFDLAAAEGSRVPQQASVTCTDGWAGLAPVGRLEASPLGLHDVQGNVTELVWADGDAPWELPPDALDRDRHVTLLGLTAASDWQELPSTPRGFEVPTTGGGRDVGLRLVRNRPGGGELPDPALVAAAQPLPPLQVELLDAHTVLDVAPLAVLPPHGLLAPEEVPRVHALLVEAARAGGGRFVTVMDPAEVQERLALHPALGPCPSGPGEAPCLRRKMDRLGVPFVADVAVREVLGGGSLRFDLEVAWRSRWSSLMSGSALAGGATLDDARVRELGTRLGVRAAEGAALARNQLASDVLRSVRVSAWASGHVRRAVDLGRRQLPEGPETFRVAELHAFLDALATLPRPLPHVAALDLPEGALTVLVVFDPSEARRLGAVRDLGLLGEVVGPEVQVLGLASAGGVPEGLPFPVRPDPGVLDPAFAAALGLHAPYVLVVDQGQVVWVGDGDTTTAAVVRTALAGETQGGPAR